MADRQRQRRFEALLHEHRGIVYKVAGLYARRAADRDDLAQEIIVQLWRAFGRYDPDRRFSTWMYRIALNVGISYLRQERKRDGRLEPLDAYLADTVGGGAPIVEPDERLQQLQGFIAQLDALNRALILLYLEDRSYAQIAEILGISETNVATKLNRIKQRLRVQMTAAAIPIGA